LTGNTCTDLNFRPRKIFNYFHASALY